jgi:hypothetical protein
VILPLLALSAISPLAQAAEASSTNVPGEAGLWSTIDDDKHIVTSVMRLAVDKDGKLMGWVIRILNPDAPKDGLCSECQGDRHNRPVEGMVVLWGMARDGEKWTGGRILDPGDGKEYRCTVQLKDPERLEVRGYIGISLFGRTQIWERYHGATLPEPAAAQP